MRSIVLPAVLVAALGACHAPEELVSSNRPAGPSSPESVASVFIGVDTIALIAGSQRLIEIVAFDKGGFRVNSDRAVVTSSHTTVAAVTATSVIPVRDERTGRILQELSAAFSLRSPGWTTVRVTLDGKSDTISVFVHLKGRSDALVVDTFTVIEYRASPYLVYAPLLKLREPTGTLTAEVISVQFTLGAMTTGMCYSSIIYGPGESAHLNGIYDYLWSNDLIFVSLGGQPLAGDVATARVIVRDAAGGYGEITATGSVQRMVVNPVLPAPRGPGWQCNN